MRLTITLYIILTTCEIPHEVTPVHMVELVVDEIPQVDTEVGLPHGGLPCWLAAVGIHRVRHRYQRRQIWHYLMLGREALLGPFLTHRLRYFVDIRCPISGPGLVALHMALVCRVDTGKQHIKVAHGLVVWTFHFLHIFIMLRRMVFHYFGVHTLGIIESSTVFVTQITVDNPCLRTAILIHRYVIAARSGRILLLHHCLGKHRTIEERTVAILLTVEIRRKGKHVVGRILVHRRIGPGTDKKKRIRSIADEYHEYTQNDEREHPHRYFFTEAPEPYCEHTQEQHANPNRMTDKRHTRHGYRKEEPQTGCSGIFSSIKRADCHDEHQGQQHGIDKHAHIVAHMETIHKKEFEPLGYLDKAGHKTVEDSADNNTRHSKRDKRTLSVDITPLTVVKYEAEGRDAEQVEKMDRNRDTYHISYQNKISVGVRLVGAVFPLEHEPYHQSRAERRESIHLALYCREPECVAPRVCQSAAHTAAHNQSHLPPGYLLSIIAHDKTAHKMCHRPE